jgi:hypothetical protein
MINLTAALLSALGRDITEPGLFVELQFLAQTLRFTDRAQRAWNSQTWVPISIAMSGFQIDHTIVSKCTLAIDDADLAVSVDATVPENTGRAVKVWYFDAAATATADPVLLFDGAMDSAEGGHDRALTLACSIVDKMLPVGMLAQLMPAYMFAQEGRKLRWGNGTIEAVRRGEYA